MTRAIYRKKQILWCLKAFGPLTALEYQAFFQESAEVGSNWPIYPILMREEALPLEVEWQKRCLQPAEGTGNFRCLLPTITH